MTKRKKKKKKKKKEKKEAEEVEATKELEQKRPRYCAIIGPPGSIKGQIVEMVVKEKGLKHVSPGEALRDAIKNQTAAGVQAQEERKSQGQVSDDLQQQIVAELIASAPVVASGWILDGYPRTTFQAGALKAAGVPLVKLISVAVSDDELVRRAVGRRIDPVTHKMYHLEGLGFEAPPDDEEVLERLTQRKDDTEDRVRLRLDQYHHSNADVSELFNKTLSVDGTKEPNALLAEILEYLLSPDEPEEKSEE